MGRKVSMILLRANAGLKVVFIKLINTMDRAFDWNDIYIIRNNNLVLAGSDQVMIFDFSNRVISSNAVEVKLNEDSIIQITKNELLENVLNMTLYAFGKWGKIKGLTVERDYPQINALFGNILNQIEVEPVLSENSLRLFRYGIQITYEDLIQIILDQQQSDQIKDEQSDKTVPKEDTQVKGKYDIGLWHKIVWKSERYTFEKEALSAQEKNKNRIGNNFYKVGYQCPICKGKLSMVIYPEGEELLIETDEKGVYLSRAYTCPACHRLYTPKPQLLISEGSVYTLDFEEDTEAYEDYIEIIGKSGVRTYNCNFNQYESEYKKKISRNESQLDELCEEIESLSDQEVSDLSEKMDMGFYPQKSVERCRRIIDKEIDKRKHAAKAGKDEKQENINKNEQRKEATEKETKYIPMAGYGSKVSKISMEGKGIKKSKALKENKDIDGGKTSKKGMATDVDEEPKGFEALMGGNASQGNEASGISKASKERKDLKKNKDSEYINITETDKISKESKTSKEYEVSEKNASMKIKDTKRRRGLRINRDTKAIRGLKGNIGQTGAEDDDEFDSLFTLSRYHEEADISKSNTSAPYIDKESVLKKKAEACQGKDYSTILRTIEEIKREEVSNDIKESLLQPLWKLLEATGRKELNSLRQKIPRQISKKQYLLYKDRISQYKQVDHTADLEYLELRREEAEKQEITSFIKKANAKDRSSYMQLYHNLKKEGFTERNVAPYLENIHDRIVALDEAEIKIICGDPEELTYEKGLRAYEEITKRDLLPELKSNTLGMIDQRLTRIKLNECEQLVSKLSKGLGKLATDSLRLHFYDVRKGLRNNQEEESTVIHHALNSYASGRGKYEFPILICDASLKGNGGRGFVLTPDHIFYNTITESGTLDVMKVERITAHRGKKIYVEIDQSGKIKLSNSLNLSNVDKFTEILNDFVAYLKEKPESRDISYIAKEKHSVKCCYRCGHVYKGDNVCPKCGAKFNE